MSCRDESRDTQTGRLTQTGDERSDPAVCDVTDLVDLTAWPPGTRLIVRREPFHPAAQTSLFPSLEFRYWGHYTDQSDDPIVLDQHMRTTHVEDRIRRPKGSAHDSKSCGSSTTGPPPTRLSTPTATSRSSPDRNRAHELGPGLTTHAPETTRARSTRFRTCRTRLSSSHEQSGLTTVGRRSALQEREHTFDVVKVTEAFAYWLRTQPNESWCCEYVFASSEVWVLQEIDDFDVLVSSELFA